MKTKNRIELSTSCFLFCVSVRKTMRVCLCYLRGTMPEPFVSMERFEPTQKMRNSRNSQTIARTNESVILRLDEILAFFFIGGKQMSPRRISKQSRPFRVEALESILYDDLERFFGKQQHITRAKRFDAKTEKHNGRRLSGACFISLPLYLSFYISFLPFLFLERKESEKGSRL